MEKATKGKIGKRLLSAVLAAALLASMVLVGNFGAITASAGLSKSTGAVELSFVVPETIWLAWNGTSNPNKFELYSNGGTAVSPGSGVSDQGKISFMCPGATNITVRAATTAEYSGNSGLTASLSSASGSTSVNAIINNTSTLSLTPNTGRLICWVATFTLNGTSMSARNYSYVYAPSHLTVGAAGKTQRDNFGSGNNDNANFYALLGVHEISVKGTHAAQSKMVGDLVSGSFSGGTDNGNGSYVTTNSNGGFNNKEVTGSGGGTSTADVTGGTGRITVDTSRFNNLNQVPGLIAAYVNTSTKSNDGTYDTCYCDFPSGTRVKSWSDAGNGIKWRAQTPTSNFSIGLTSTGTTNFSTKSYSEMEHWVFAATRYNEVKLAFNVSVNKVNKAALRTAVNNAVKYPKEQGKNYDSYNNALIAACTQLGNPVADASGSNAAALNTAATNNKPDAPIRDAYFYVPETIYLKIAATGNMGTFDRYCNGGNVTRDTGSSSTGSIYFKREGATNIRVYVGGTANSCVAFSANTLSSTPAKEVFTSTITSGSLNTAIAAGAKTTICWKATYTYEGRDYEAYAFTVVQAPTRVVTASASEAESSSEYLGGILAMMGMDSHAGTGNYIPNADLIDHLVTGGHKGNNNNPAGQYLTSSSGGGCVYDRPNSKNVTSTAPRAYFRVDTSRYNNLNQVPGWRAQFHHTDDEDTDDQYSSSTGITDPDGVKILSYSASPKSSSDADGLRWSTDPSHTLRQAYTKHADFSMTLNDGSDTSGTLKHYNSRDSKSNTNNLPITVRSANKSAQRAAVRYALQYGFNKADYTSETWTAYLNALKASSENLGTSNVVLSETAANALIAKVDEMKAGTATNYHRNAAAGNAVIGTETLSYITNEAVTGSAYTAAATGTTNGVTLTGTPVTTANWEYKEHKNTTANGTVSALMSANSSTLLGAGSTMKWDFYYLPKYTVKYNKNDTAASGEMADQSFVYATEQALNALGFTKTGYHFVNWTGSNGITYTDQQRVNNLTTTGGGVVTMSASWAPNTYTVEYNANGGTGTMANQTFTYDEAAKALRENAFTLEGYTFMGWNERPDEDAKYANKALVSNLTTEHEDTVTLYAIWKPNAYTVTFDPDGGTVTPSNKTVTFNSAYGTLPVPVKAGYGFGGWYTQQNGADALITDSSTVATAAAHTLYAKWTAGQQTLTINPDNGSGTTTVTQATATTYELPTPSKTGYSFDKWELQTGSFGTLNESGGVYTYTFGAGAGTVKALWTVNTYKVTLDPNSGEVTPAELTVTYGKRYDEAVGGWPSANRLGYTFEGWHTDIDDDTQVNGSDTVAITADTTLYAHWSINQYELTIVRDDGVTQDEGRQADYGDTYVLPTPEKTGYTFNGWVLEAGYKGSLAENDGTYTYTYGAGNDKVIAQWTANKYTVVYNKNNTSATGTMLDTVHTYDVAQRLSGNLYALEGYTFTGWATAADGTGSEYEDQQEVINLCTADEAVLNLYAQWDINEYTLTIDKADGSEPQLIMQDYNTTHTLEAAPTREGYIFGGWVLEAGHKGSLNGLIYTFGAGNDKAVAQWTPITYTVIYNKNADDATGTTNETNHTFGTPQELRSNGFSRTGYAFDGWSEADDGSGRQFSNEENVSDLTSTQGGEYNLYALWRPIEYNIVWDFDGGVIDVDGDDITSAFTTETYNALYQLPGVPLKNQYVFAGWYTEDGKLITDTTLVTDATLSDATMLFPETMPTRVIAHYTYTGFYPLAYNLNGGNIDGDTASVGEKKAKIGDTYAYGSDNMPLKEPVRTGYTFQGWFVGDSTAQAEPGEKVSLATLDPGADDDYTTLTTYTARWAKNAYDVKFDPGAGTLADANGGVVAQMYDTMYALPENQPTREGYRFDGWFAGDTQITDKVNVDNNTLDPGAVSPALAAIFTAKWTANEYAVQYDLKGGNINGATDSVPGTVTYGVEYAPPAGVARTGYSFVKWQTLAGVVITADTVVSSDNLTAQTMAKPTDATRIEALWDAKPYKVAFDADGGKFGDGDTSKQADVIYDAAYTVPAADPERTGYTFKGWFQFKNGVGAEITNATIVSSANMNPDADTAAGELAMTFYAKWEANGITVSFAPNGGTACADKQVTFDSPYGTLPGTTKTGYIFKGWYKEAALENLVEGATIVSNAANHTLYAKWEAVKYILAYDAQGGTPAPAQQTDVPYDSTLALPAAPAKDGYTFDAWYTQQNGGGTKLTTDPAMLVDNKILSNDSMLSPATATTFYANWTANKYDVTFDNNDGTATPGTEVKEQTYGSKFVLPGTNPTRDGYSFAGWATDKNGGDPITAETIADGSLLNISKAPGSTATFYAQWTAKLYTIKYNAADGNFADDSKEKTFSALIYDVAKPAPETPKKTGYTFSGWYTTPDTVAGGVQLSGSTVGDILSDASKLAPATATVYYARYTPNQYTVAFDSQGGSTHGDMQVTYGSKFGELPTPTKDGYIFDGWLNAKNNTITKDSIADEDTLDAATIANDPPPATILTAQWAPKNYSVTYNLNGGNIGGATANVVSDVTFNKAYSAGKNYPGESADVILKDGYTFAGWYKEAELTNAVPGATLVSNAANHMLYAKWTAKQYKLAFDSQNGSAVEEQDGIDYNSELALPAAPAKDGYTFDAWYTQPNGGGTKLEADMPVDKAILSAASMQDPATATTFYANWTAEKYLVTFANNDGTAASTDVNQTFGGKYVLPGTNPTRDGYTFAGWNTLADGKGTAITADVTVASPPLDIAKAPGSTATFYAQWTEVDYTIKYDANGGVYTDNSALKTHFALWYDNAKPTPEEPVKKGYSFDGWYTTPALGGAALDGSTVGDILSADSKRDPATATTYYARYTAKQYDVLFDSQGGSTHDGKQVTYDNVFGPLPTPAKDGYIFDGWFTAGTGGNKISESTAVNDTTLNPAALTDGSPTTLYAQWTAKTFAVVYNLDGGSKGGSGADISDTVKFGETYAQGANWPGEDPAAITKTGYTFIGWYTEKNGGGSSVTAATAVPHNLTSGTVYYAYWAPSDATLYKVQIYLQNANDDQYALVDTLTRFGATDALTDFDAALWAQGYPNYVYTDHPDKKLTDTIAADGSTVLKIYFNRKMVNLHYNLQGGTGTGFESKAYRWGQTVDVVAAEPIWASGAYKFSKWELREDVSGTKLENGKVTMGSADATLYALWETKPFTITLVADGDPEGTLEVEIGKPFNKDGKLPQPDIGDEWMFIGWSYDGITMINENDIVSSEASPLIACYVRIYKVTYHANGGTIVSEGNETTDRKVWYGGEYGEGITFDGSALDAVPEASRGADYTFLYWYYIDPATQKEVQVDDPVIVAHLGKGDPRNPMPAVNTPSPVVQAAPADEVIPTIYAKWTERSATEEPEDPEDGLGITEIIIGGVIGAVVGSVGSAGILGALGTVAAVVALPVAYLLGKLFPGLELPDWLQLNKDKDKEPEPTPEPDNGGSTQPESTNPDGYVKPPKTGDNWTIQNGAWALLLLCGGGLTVLLRRREDEDEALA